MSQYDVFENPIPRARDAFPFVTVLQSELANTGRDRMVAPLVARVRMPGISGRLTPIVKVLGVEHVLLVPRMAPVGVIPGSARRLWADAASPSCLVNRLLARRTSTRSAGGHEREHVAHHPSDPLAQVHMLHHAFEEQSR